MSKIKIASIVSMLIALPAQSFAADPNIYGKVFQFKEPLNLTQLDRNKYFNGTDDDSDNTQINHMRITRAKQECFDQIAGLWFPYPMTNAKYIDTYSQMDNKKIVYLVGGKTYSPNDLSEMAPLKKDKDGEYTADCSKVLATFGAGACMLSVSTDSTTSIQLKQFGFATTGGLNHSLILNASVDNKGSIDGPVTVSAEADSYPLDEKKTVLNPKIAAGNGRSPLDMSCYYNRVASKEEQKKNLDDLKMFTDTAGGLAQEYREATDTKNGEHDARSTDYKSNTNSSTPANYLETNKITVDTPK